MQKIRKISMFWFGFFGLITGILGDLYFNYVKDLGIEKNYSGSGLVLVFEKVLGKLFAEGFPFVIVICAILAGAIIGFVFGPRLAKFRSWWRILFAAFLLSLLGLLIFSVIFTPVWSVVHNSQLQNITLQEWLNGFWIKAFFVAFSSLSGIPVFFKVIFILGGWLVFPVGLISAFLFVVNPAK